MRELLARLYRKVRKLATEPEVIVTPELIYPIAWYGMNLNLLSMTVYHKKYSFFDCEIIHEITVIDAFGCNWSRAGPWDTDLLPTQSISWSSDSSSATELVLRYRSYP